MNTLLQVLVALLSLFLAWRVFKTLKAHPELLSKENVNKSLGTMGLLALALIAFVALLVTLVN